MFDSKPKMITVRLSQIVTDPYVNRELDRAWVDALVKNWDSALKGVPQVAEIDGRYIPLDGQHRLEALREMHADDPRVDVLCHYGLSKQQAARLFVGLNKNRAIIPFEKFVKLVFAGDPVPSAINTIVQRNGLKLSQSGSSGSVACVTHLQKAYNRDKVGAHLETALQLLIAAWGRDAGNFKGPIVDGLSWFLSSRAADLNLKRLVKVMQKIRNGGNGLLEKGRSYQDLHGGTLPGGVAESLGILYDKGRRSPDGTAVAKAVA